MSVVPPLNDYFLHLSQSDLTSIEEFIKSNFVNRSWLGLEAKDWTSFIMAICSLCATVFIGWITANISKQNNSIMTIQTEIEKNNNKIQEFNNDRDIFQKRCDIISTLTAFSNHVTKMYNFGLKKRWIYI